MAVLTRILMVRTHVPIRGQFFVDVATPLVVHPKGRLSSLHYAQLFPGPRTRSERGYRIGLRQRQSNHWPGSVDEISLAEEDKN